MWLHQKSVLAFKQQKGHPSNSSSELEKALTLLGDHILEELSPHPTHFDVAATLLSVFSFSTNGSQERSR